MRACPSGLSLANGISTPIRRICPDCCARKASGQATAEPPTSVMNSRRLIAFPEAKDKQSYRFTSAAMHKIAVKYQAHTSALGQQTTLQADRHMSALPSVADIAEAREHVRYGPLADLRGAASFGHSSSTRSEELGGREGSGAVGGDDGAIGTSVIAIQQEGRYAKRSAAFIQRDRRATSRSPPPRSPVPSRSGRCARRVGARDAGW